MAMEGIHWFLRRQNQVLPRSPSPINISGRELMDNLRDSLQDINQLITDAKDLRMY